MLSNINRFGVHWRIGGRWSCGATLCGSTDSTKGHKGGKCHWGQNTTIHRSVGGSTVIHRGVGNGRSTMKGDGDWEAWVKNYSEKKTHDAQHSYNSGERY